MRTRQPAPLPSVWRWLGLAAVTLLLLAVATIAVISAGVVDPGPRGSPLARHAPGPQRVPAGSQALTWVAGALPSSFAARLTVAHLRGERDSGYGLALGEDEAYLVAAVSPLGYAAVWQRQGNRDTFLLPWQPWPHVARGTSPNEIQIEIEGPTATVRVNRERLWQGAIALPARAAGSYIESFGGPATADFQDLSLYRLSPAD